MRLVRTDTLSPRVDDVTVLVVITVCVAEGWNFVKCGCANLNSAGGRCGITYACNMILVRMSTKFMSGGCRQMWRWLNQA